MSNRLRMSGPGGFGIVKFEKSTNRKASIALSRPIPLSILTALPQSKLNSEWLRSDSLDAFRASSADLKMPS
jgi:hypothetical protein